MSDKSKTFTSMLSLDSITRGYHTCRNSHEIALCVVFLENNPKTRAALTEGDQLMSSPPV